ncbi:MAG: hypothetical protein ACTHV2_03100 [Brachybacterium sp.]|uniref:hypothetical protein n=1 Tax=Brachybacterium sp. TaxID=1891286 RepID=UPI00264C02CF|nr:hypothetical protein [Brachybacterium sp.]MDN6328083.1 hypothetical protein [Brachybacterium sp.]MDN6399274.1 hypothetical protein [Brachybacterium sp.]
MSPQPETSDASERPAAAPRRRTAGDRSMQRATVIAVAVGLVLDVIVLIVAATRPESTALAGALVGTGLTLVVVLPSMAIAFLGPRLSPMSMAATVLGSWAVKMFVVILILLLVRDLPSLSTQWIGVALLVGAVSAMIVEATLLMRTRQPLDVEPARPPGEPPAQQ